MYVLGIIGGALLAFYEGTVLDKVGSTVLITANSVPYYIVGMILLAVLAFQVGIFPTGGKVDPNLTAGFNMEYVASMFYHAILPIVSFAMTAVGGVVLTMRGNSIQVLGSEYMRVGRLRGLSDSWLSRHYVAHNAVLPLYTQLMTSVGFVFGGSVILETIFRYQGAGFYIYRAIQTRDQPLMMGGFLVITLAVVIALFFADLTYSRIDPRLSTGDEEAY
jgi:peptide/nickel transport system permease protein